MTRALYLLLLLLTLIVADMMPKRKRDPVLLIEAALWFVLSFMLGMGQ